MISLRLLDPKIDRWIGIKPWIGWVSIMSWSDVAYHHISHMMHIFLWGGWIGPMVQYLWDSLPRPGIDHWEPMWDETPLQLGYLVCPYDWFHLEAKWWELACSLSAQNEQAKLVLCNLYHLFLVCIIFCAWNCLMHVSACRLLMFCHLKVGLLLNFLKEHSWSQRTTKWFDF